jgi:hypothetical protein
MAAVCRWWGEESAAAAEGTGEERDAHLFDLGGALGVREAAEGCAEFGEDVGCLSECAGVSTPRIMSQREYLETVYFEVGHDGMGCGRIANEPFF